MLDFTSAFFNHYLELPGSFRWLSGRCACGRLEPLGDCRRKAVEKLLSETFGKFPLDPRVARDPDVHVLMLSSASLSGTFPIFDRMSIELRNFIFDCVDDAGFTGLHLRTPDNMIIQLDCMEFGEMPPDEREFAIGTLIPYFRAVNDFLAQAWDRQGFCKVLEFDPWEKFELAEAFYILHAGCTGWPLGRFSHVPAIYRLSERHDDDMIFSPVGCIDPSFLPSLRVKANLLRKLAQIDGCVYAQAK